MLRMVYLLNSNSLIPKLLMAVAFNECAFHVCPIKLAKYNLTFCKIYHSDVMNCCHLKILTTMK